MAHQLERLMEAIRAKPGRVILIALLAFGLLWFFFGRNSKESEVPAPAEQSHQVTAAPFVIVKGFRGIIAPGDSVAIVAPFDGAVKTINFAYGDRVDAGQVLLQIDPSDVETSRNEAESGYLKAVEKADEIQNWNAGLEMTRARRGVTSAELELHRAERRLEETKALLDRGLVPRAEYENLQQQVELQQIAVRTAEENLQETERKGSGTPRRISSLELANATRRFQRIDSDYDGATVTAPSSGIIVLPPTGGGGQTGGGGGSGGDPNIGVGSRLSKGQTVGAIASVDGLAVTFELDESDVNAVQSGQPALINGGGFPFNLNGRVHSVAGQANSAPLGGKISFKATVRLAPLTPAQMDAVRIGMSANIRVMSYRNPKALTVPVPALQGPFLSRYVMVRQKDGTTRRVPVKIGKIAPDRVEIITGLKAGDVVVWTPPAPPRPPGSPQKPKGRLFNFL